MVGVVGQPNVFGVFVRIAVDCHRFDTEFRACLNDSNGDLVAVRDQHPFEHNTV